MKKLLVMILVLSFAVMAHAEDRLKLDGEIRVRAYSWQNNGFTDGNDKDYYDMRLRLGGKIAVEKDVTAVFRMDFAENKFGTPDSEEINNGYNSKDANRYSQIQVDKAYIDINKPMYELKAGQQGFMLGHVIDHTGAGFILDAKLPVTVTVLFTKLDENGSVSDEDDDNKDKNVYGAQVQYKNDALDARLFGAYQVNNKKDDAAYVDKDTQSAVGVAVTSKISMISIDAEVDFLSGSKYDNVTDYVGSQAWVDASAKLSDMFTVGSQFIYAKGTDKADEEQISYITYDADWLILPYGDGDAELVNPYEIATNAGSIGILPYIKVKPMTDLTINAQYSYLTPETDTNTKIDSISAITLKGTYMLAKSTKLVLEYDYADVSGDSSKKAAQLIFAKLATKF